MVEDRDAESLIVPKETGKKYTAHQLNLPGAGPGSQRVSGGESIHRNLNEEVSKAQLLSDNEAACTPHYLHQWSQFNKAEKTCTQAWTWETQLKHAAFFHYLQRNQDDIRSGFTSITEHEKKENRLELTPFFNFLQGLWV
ncbi:hypothetical protein FQA47_019116 [Oryzias melastigma]|uniref:Uncharacterized protein n=1 Tax=Oryzias melastigma TaxID=30732 RepID=A0A834CFK8_ORYME|nr:hypothetical protein FQA47_019116 [Oryzias melastigma]